MADGRRRLTLRGKAGHRQTREKPAGVQCAIATAKQVAGDAECQPLHVCYRCYQHVVRSYHSQYHTIKVTAMSTAEITLLKATLSRHIRSYGLVNNGVVIVMATQVVNELLLVMLQQFGVEY